MGTEPAIWSWSAGASRRHLRPFGPRPARHALRRCGAPSGGHRPHCSRLVGTAAAEGEERGLRGRAAMAEPAREELSALAAIFCGPNEWEVLSCSDGTVFKILTKAEGLTDADVPLELVFHLPVSYPSCLPGISVHSEHLTRAQAVTVKDKLLEQAENLLSGPMVHELILWIQQNLRHILNQPETGSGSEKCTFATSVTVGDGLWMTLLHLDHMRAKAKYVKTVEKWASDLKLTGRLMFLGKIILILLQGDRNSLKEYLVLQKTSKIDVDSSGKKCKEKMMSVLFETKVQAEHKRFLAFEVKEYSSLDALQKEFETAGLMRLFSEFVLGLVK
ncbi:RWD domain-containing protein 3 isoform X2 [Manis pentadactyla]|uniref:RWD domain-containing protein 3 isoform X2 n=1 Tax=Manis pentadactyla TaxID=143292 RepID=UPI00255CCAEE|nr:RWD domain-containing protein 3 isoform X2 [Manis pentadactyla]